MTVASCPAIERIAAAASGEDDDFAAHAESCDACRDAMTEQFGMRALLARLPAPPLVGTERQTLEALVRARIDEPSGPIMIPTTRRWPVATGIVAFAAAATIAIVVALPSPDAPPAPVAPSVAIVAPTPPPAPIAFGQVEPARIDMSAADADRPATDVDHPATPVAEAAPERDEVVTLRGGTLTIDARERRAPVDVVAGPAKVHVADAKVRITALAGVVSRVQVFAGSVEMTVDGHHTVIRDVWTAPALPTAPGGDVTSLEPPSRTGHAPKAVDAPAAPQTPTERAMIEFRLGWKELHDEHYNDAIVHFDHATDPVVAEDATYWAAIAVARAGRLDDAVVRLRAFTTAFPSSPHLDDARSALSKLVR